MGCDRRDDENQKNVKKLKLDEENNEKDNKITVTAVVSVDDAECVNIGEINNDSPPSIFKLDIDCCEELFEYLSIVDLHSLGQTCTRMHHFTGYFVRENYKSTLFEWSHKYLFIDYHGYQMVNGFIEFISNLRIASNQLEQIAGLTTKFKSIKGLILHLNGDEIVCIKDILEKCEKITIFDDRSKFTGDLYEKIFKFCTNLKQLEINVDDFKMPMVESNIHWLQYKYPKLEHVDLYSSSLLIVKMPSDRLKTFFSLNEGIRKLRIGALLLWENRQWILDSNIKLIEISIRSLHRDLFILCVGRREEFINLLNTLYDRGFYERLSLHDVDSDSHILTTIRAPLTLHLETYFSPIPTLDLREINVSQIGNIDELSTNFANNHSTIERIKIHRLETIDKILFFIRKFKNLKEIHINHLEDANSFYLTSLNKERERLVGARRVTIYLSRCDYNPRMRMNNFDLVKIKCLG